MAGLTVKLFGEFSVCREEPLHDSIPGKAKELFCYLLTHRQRHLGREFLASVLWGDCTTEHSKQYLRKAIWQLQRALCEADASAESILQVNSQWVSLNSEANIWVDVTEFERLCSADQNPSGSVNGSRTEALETALDLYRGDLLEGWYQDWCLYERERLQNLYLVRLDKIVALFETSDEYAKAADYATRILKYDRAQEIAHQRLMRLRYLQGDRAGALRQFENCAAALKEELGVQPSERTRELYQKIREEHASLMTTGGTSGQSEPEGESSLLRDALKRLLEVKSTLVVLQTSVDESVSRVRHALQGSNDDCGPVSQHRI